MSIRSVQYILFLSLIFSSFCCVYRFKKLDAASKVLSILIFAGFFTEVIAFFLARRFHNNLRVYSIYSLIEFCLFCTYFNFIIDTFKRKNVGIYLGIAGLLFWIADILFIEHFDGVNSNFLFFEGIVIIGMSLKAFARWLSDEDFIYAYKYPHFWFVCVFVFFWTITYLSWGLNYYYNKKMQHVALIINYALLVVNIATYIALGSIFLLYPKMKK